MHNIEEFKYCPKTGIAKYSMIDPSKFVIVHASDHRVKCDFEHGHYNEFMFDKKHLPSTGVIKLMVPVDDQIGDALVHLYVRPGPSGLNNMPIPNTDDRFSYLTTRISVVIKDMVVQSAHPDQTTLAFSVGAPANMHHLNITITGLGRRPTDI